MTENNLFLHFIAAHCFRPKDSREAVASRDILAIFGAHDLKNHYETGRYSLSPIDVISHKDWNPGTSQYYADLSLLQFEHGSILFNSFIQPICLWDSENDPTEMEAEVVGWGKSEDQTKKHEDKPKLVKTLILSNELCLPGERELASLSSQTTFCAGLKNGSGVCTGDSGGGLFIKVDNIYHLRGIVSASLLKGQDCDV